MEGVWIVGFREFFNIPENFANFPRKFPERSPKYPKRDDRHPKWDDPHPKRDAHPLPRASRTPCLPFRGRRVRTPTPPPSALPRGRTTNPPIVPGSARAPPRGTSNRPSAASTPRPSRVARTQRRFGGRPVPFSDASASHALAARPGRPPRSGLMPDTPRRLRSYL